MAGLLRTSDASLVARVLGGEREAFGRLVERYHGPAFAVALGTTRNATDAEDVVQETFLRALQSLNQLQTPKKFGPWLISIAKNQAQDLLRKRRRAANLTPRSASDTPSPATQLLTREAAMLLHEHINALEDDPREILLLYYLGRLDTRRIARLLGISDAAARKRLQRARDTLGKNLVDSLGSQLQPIDDAASLKKILSLTLAASVPWRITAGTVPGMIGFSAGLKLALAGAAASTAVVVAVWMMARESTEAPTFQTSTRTAQTSEDIAPIEPTPEPVASTLPSTVAEPPAVAFTGTVDRSAEGFALARADGWPIPSGQGLTSPDANMPLAWYLLRTPNIGYPLVSMAYRLRPLSLSENRAEPAWQGSNGGATLRLNIQVEGVPDEREVHIGFFADPTWSSDPVFVREIPGAGEHVIDDMSPGEYYIGAIIPRNSVDANFSEQTPRDAIDSNEAKPVAIGINDTWPNPIVLEAGQTTSSRVLVASDFDWGLGAGFDGIFEGYASAHEDLNADTMLQGRVTDENGAAVAFPIILIREYKDPEHYDGYIDAPDTGGNVSGEFFFDGLKWRYTVYAQRNEFFPHTFASRLTQLAASEPMLGPSKLNFEIPEWPRGTASLTGTMHDDRGNPIEHALVRIYTRGDQSALHFSCSYPFLESNGTFRIDNLPQGEYNVFLLPLDTIKNPHFDADFAQAVEVDFFDGRSSEVEFVFPAKSLRFGAIASPILSQPGKRVQVSLQAEMSDGLTLGRMTTDVDAQGRFQINLSGDDIEKLRSGELTLHVSHSTIGDPNGYMKPLVDFPAEYLATSPADVRTLVVK